MFHCHILDAQRSQVKLLGAISTFPALFDSRHRDREFSEERKDVLKAVHSYIQC